MRAKAQLTTKQRILLRFVEFRGLHRFNAVKFFLEKNLDEFRLINFILDKLEILYYTIITKRKEKIKCLGMVKLILI